MMYSAISKKYYDLSVIIGLISMVSFVVLSKFVAGDINAELSKVLKVDIVGICVLVIGYAIYKFK